MKDDELKLASLEAMKEYSRRFVEDREWTNFHTPKNIAIGISVESAELLEIFQWLTESQSFAIKDNLKKIQQVKDELGDIFHLLIRISTLLDIDLVQSFWEKMKKNEEKYPIHLSKGKANKYSELANGKSEQSS
jgi:dCTP diphosphatase